MRLAGIAGIIGGVVVTVVAISADALGYIAVTLSHSLMYALMLAALLGANARYGAGYGRLGRVVVLLLGTAAERPFRENAQLGKRL